VNSQAVVVEKISNSGATYPNEMVGLLCQNEKIKVNSRVR
jgi:hypothetical protein